MYRAISLAIVVLALMLSGCGDGSSNSRLAHKRIMTPIQKKTYDRLLADANVYHLPNVDDAEMKRIADEAEKAKLLEPEMFNDAWDYIVEILKLVSGDPELHWQNIDKYTKKYPKSEYSPLLLEKYGEYLTEDENSEKAEVVYALLLKDYPKYKPLNTKYMYLIHLFEQDKMEQAFLVADEISKHSFEFTKEFIQARLVKAIVHCERGEYDAAIDNLWAHYLLREMGVGDEEAFFAKTRATFETLVKNCKETRPMDVLALQAFYYGFSSDVAFDFAVEFVKHDIKKENAGFAYVYAKMMIALGDASVKTTDVFTHLNNWEAVAEDGGALFFALKLSLIYEAEKYHEVLRRFNAAPDIVKRSPFVTRWAALACMYFDFYKEAEEYAQHTLETFPDNTQMQMIASVCSIIGQSAPDIFAKNVVTGAETSLADHRGKIVILDFRKYEDGITCDEVEMLLDIYRKYNRNQVEIISVVFDYTEDHDLTFEDVKSEFDSRKMTWNVVLGGVWDNSKIQDLYHVMEVPFLLIISPDGSIDRYKKYGEYLYTPIEEFLEYGPDSVR